MVWYSASYRVCVTSTLFPLRLTFLAQRSPFQDIHFVLLMLRFLYVTSLHLFVYCLVSHGHVHQSVQQDHVLCISVPTNRHYYREHDTFSCFFIRQSISQTIFDNLYFSIICYLSTFHCIHLRFWRICF